MTSINEVIRHTSLCASQYLCLLLFVQACVTKNKGTVYSLMASHGDKENLIRLTIANKDFERVIRHHIHKGDFLKGKTFSF